MKYLEDDVLDDIEFHDIILQKKYVYIPNIDKKFYLMMII